MISYNNYPMPLNWEMKYDFATKKHFFVNHKTKTTTWNDPRKEIFEKDDSNSHFVNANDFMGENDDLTSVIKELNEKDTLETFMKRLKEKFPTISNDVIKDIFKKSKGNFSNAEVLLRQETRKETSSILSSSTINYGSSGHESKCTNLQDSRFNLTERSTYKAPETSNDRIKFQLRQEFFNVDIRIVDRVLEITNFSLEDSRKIISKTKTEKMKDLEDYSEKPDFNMQRQIISTKENDEKTKFSKKDSNLFGNFKHFVTRRSNQKAEETISNELCNKYRKSLATGPDPKNFKGSKIKRET